MNILKTNIALGASLFSLGLAVLIFVRPDFRNESRTEAGVDRAPTPDAPPTAEAPVPLKATDTEVRHETSYRPSIEISYTAAPANKDEMEAEAEFVAQKLLDDMSGEPVAIHVNALLSAQLHHTEKAEELWRECIRIDPDTDNYYVNLAAIALDRGDSELAIQTLETAVERGLNSADVSHHLGVALTNVGRPEEGAKVAQTTLEQLPNSAPHWLILGQAKLRLGDSQAAEECLRKAIQLGANSKPAYFALFNACIRNGRKEDAKKFRDIYLAFDQNDGLDVQERYQILSEAEAKRVLTSVLSESATLYFADGQSKEAEHLLLRILALVPNNSSALGQLADVYSATRQLANERLIRRRMVELDPRNLLNYLLLAKLELACENPEAAEAAIRRAISLAPRSVTGYATMADFQLERGRPEEALWYVNYAVALEPSRDAYLLLAKVYRAMSDEDAAQNAEAKIETL